MADSSIDRVLEDIVSRVSIPYHVDHEDRLDTAVLVLILIVKTLGPGMSLEECREQVMEMLTRGMPMSGVDAGSPTHGTMLEVYARLIDECIDAVGRVARRGEAADDVSR